MLPKNSQTGLFERFWSLTPEQIAAFREKGAADKLLHHLLQDLPGAIETLAKPDEASRQDLANHLLNLAAAIEPLKTAEAQVGQEVVFMSKEQLATEIVLVTTGWLEAAKKDGGGVTVGGVWQILVDCFLARQNYDNAVYEYQRKLLSYTTCLIGSLGQSACSAEKGDLDVAWNNLANAIRDTERLCFRQIIGP